MNIEYYIKSSRFSHEHPAIKKRIAAVALCAQYKVMAENRMNHECSILHSAITLCCSFFSRKT